MGHPLVRVDKLHPDGSLRASWYGYRIGDRDGAVRIFRPPGTRLVHVNGLWLNTGWTVSAFHPDWAFVPHRWVDGARDGIYIDVVRSTAVRRDRVEYVDLYLDVMVHADGVRDKDEELLVRLDPGEAQRVRLERDRVRRLIAEEHPALQRDSAFWTLPDDARALPPKHRRRSRHGIPPVR